MECAKKVLSFGEIVWDIFENEKTLGGAPLNFAYYCSKLGANAKILSAVGTDANGDAALEMAQKAGIDTSLVERIDGAETGRVLVRQTGATHTFEICSPAAWDLIELSPAAEEFASKADAFCFGTLSQRSLISAGTLKKIISLLPGSCLKIFDANLRQNFFTKDTIEFCAASADMLKLNDDELAVFRRIFSMDGYSDAHTCEKLLRKFGLARILLTRGSKGYSIFDKSGKSISAAANPVDLVDSVGAGDSFTAAFTMSVLNGEDSAVAAAKAQGLAEKVCSRRGALCL